MPGLAVCEGFDHLPACCEALFARAEAHSVFLGLPWFRTLGVYAAADGDRLRVYLLGRAGKIDLAMPMWHDAANTGKFRIRRLRAAANFYTPLFRPVLAEDVDARETLTRFARAVASGKTDMLNMHPLDSDDPVFAHLLAALRSAGMAAQPYRCFGNWYLVVGGRSYAEYSATLPSRLRNTLKRKGQLLNSAGRLRMEIVGGGAGLDAAIAAYEAVYQASWKPPEANPHFMPQLIRMCAQRGWLRLGIAWIDGRPAAAQVWIVAHGVASIYKLAYDQQFVKHSAGSLLTAHLMRHVIDVDGVHTVDFLSGDDDYKQDWMSHRRERWGIAAFNLRTAPGIALTAVHFGRSLAKYFFHRLARRRPRPHASA